jgi:GNAT superfamily N-acetyltransferase
MFSIINHIIAEKGYYINLDNSIDRRVRVEEQIEKYNINGLERFPALTDSWHQYSCTKSHLAILQKCFDENIETVMIFEDDFQIYDECKFAHNTLNLNDCLTNVDNDLNFEIAYLGIFKEFFGKKIGAYLLAHAIENCFMQGAKKVWVHTCTLDHPNALKNYLARGMTIFKTEKIFFNPENL